jgi:polyhydroxybutyrate depolymerase
MRCMGPQGSLATVSIFPGAVGQGWQLYAGEFDDRDVSFFDAMLARLSAQYYINPRRVYVTGHSNGAYLSHILACLRGATIAAIGPMAGAVSSCPGSERVAVILSHGTMDTTVPYGSGLAARDFWLTRNDCAALSEPYAKGCEIHPQCADDHQVAFCSFGGMHVPDPHFPPNMYRFFREHAL